MQIISTFYELECGERMDLLRETRRILSLYKVTPRKKIGQNFVVDTSLLHRMVSYASISREDTVLEVGAGLGFLTEILAERSKHVIAVDVDSRLVKLLKERLHNLGNISILRGDILKLIVPPFNKVVSTPPYPISSPLLLWLLEKKFDCAILTFQKEFAERLVASPGSKDYGRLTIATYHRTNVELLDYVFREMFWPPPDVDSIIVRIRLREPPPFKVKDEDIFFKIVRALFSQRNRKVRNAIMPFLNELKICRGDAMELAKLIPFHNSRTRELTPEEIGLIADVLLSKVHEKGIL